MVSYIYICINRFYRKIYKIDCLFLNYFNCIICIITIVKSKMSLSQQQRLSQLQEYFTEEIFESNEKDDMITDLSEFQEYLFDEFDNANNETNNARRELEETKKALLELQIKYDKKEREHKWVVDNLLKKTVEANHKLFEIMKKISFEAEMGLVLEHLIPPRELLVPPKLKRQSNINFQQRLYNSPEPRELPKPLQLDDYEYEEDDGYKTPKSATFRRKLWSTDEDYEEADDGYKTPKSDTFRRKLWSTDEDYEDEEWSNTQLYDKMQLDPDEGGVELDFFDESDLNIVEEFNRNNLHPL
jgi:hypothetical protein